MVELKDSRAVINIECSICNTYISISNLISVQAELGNPPGTASGICTKCGYKETITKQ